MSESTSKKKKKKERDKKRAGGPPKRRERRFVPHSATNPWVYRVLGAVAGAIIGSGVWGYFWAKSFALLEEKDKMRDMPAYLIAAGAVLMAVAIWLGTSSDPPVRVGDPGIAIEKGEARRMPWWAVKQISFESGSLALVVSGKDEASKDWVLKIPLKSHPDAIGWILKEAEERIPRRLDVSESMIEKLPRGSEHAGMPIDLEPLQVVGRKCSVTGRTISYEPDARVCPRCERVYYKKAAPKKCKCGLSLEHLRLKSAEDGEADSEEETSDEATSARTSVSEEKTSTKEPSARARAEEEAES